MSSEERKKAAKSTYLLQKETQWTLERQAQKNGNYIHLNLTSKQQLPQQSHKKDKNRENFEASQKKWMKRKKNHVEKIKKTSMTDDKIQVKMNEAK